VGISNGLRALSAIIQQTSRKLCDNTAYYRLIVPVNEASLLRQYLFRTKAPHNIISLCYYVGSHPRVSRMVEGECCWPEQMFTIGETGQSSRASFNFHHR
jgi:hypothetical protein